MHAYAHIHMLTNIRAYTHALQYSFPFIKSPIFILNSLYDTAQLTGNLGMVCLPPCCDAGQMTFFENFRNVR